MLSTWVCHSDQQGEHLFVNGECESNAQPLIRNSEKRKRGKGRQRRKRGRRRDRSADNPLIRSFFLPLDILPHFFPLYLFQLKKESTADEDSLTGCVQRRWTWGARTEKQLHRHSAHRTGHLHLMRMGMTEDKKDNNHRDTKNRSNKQQQAARAGTTSTKGRKRRQEEKERRKQTCNSR